LLTTILSFFKCDYPIFGLDIPIVLEIIMAIKPKAVTEESRLAEAARDMQPKC